VQPLLVIALGGNALQDPRGDDSVDSDFDRTALTAEKLVQLAANRGWRLVITHGNGPQVGNHLLRSELAVVAGHLPPLPLEVCVADTQGGLGYMLQQCLTNAFAAAGLPAVVASVITQVIVDVADPAFTDPSKPIGEMIRADRVVDLRAQGWDLVEDPARGGWRRIVPSPEPIEIVEAGAIRALLDDGVVVVAAGGGGVPVVQGDDGGLHGVAAVVDKDLASALLAADLGAQGLLIVTDVERAALAYGTADERPLETLTVAQARDYLAADEFGRGSMAPKVEACCRFVESGGDFGIITSIDQCDAALAGDAGTWISG
jgi:carbamate kinase